MSIRASAFALMPGSNLVTMHGMTRWLKFFSCKNVVIELEDHCVRDILLRCDMRMNAFTWLSSSSSVCESLQSVIAVIS
jgi:hypothetical protein